MSATIAPRPATMAIPAKAAHPESVVRRDREL